MKSFHLTVWSIIGLFALLMAIVAASALLRKSNACNLDPAQIGEIRSLAEK